MSDGKSIQTIADEAHKMVSRVLNNNFKTETCPEKKVRSEQKKEKVVQELIVRLGSVGPKEIK